MNIPSLFYRISIGTIFIASIGLLYIFYLLFFPANITVLRQPLISPPSIVHGGETIHTEIAYCKKIEGISHFAISMNSAEKAVIPLPSLTANAPLGCGTFYFATLIPTDIPKGKYEIVYSLEYQVNPVQTATEIFETKTFMIE